MLSALQIKLNSPPLYCGGDRSLTTLDTIKNK